MPSAVQSSLALQASDRRLSSSQELGIFQRYVELCDTMRDVIGDFPDSETKVQVQNTVYRHLAESARHFQKIRGSVRRAEAELLAAAEDGEELDMAELLGSRAEFDVALRDYVTSTHSTSAWLLSGVKPRSAAARIAAAATTFILLYYVLGMLPPFNSAAQADVPTSSLSVVAEAENAAAPTTEWPVNEASRPRTERSWAAPHWPDDWSNSLPPDANTGNFKINDSVLQKAHGEASMGIAGMDHATPQTGGTGNPASGARAVNGLSWLGRFALPAVGRVIVVKSALAAIVAYWVYLTWRPSPEQHWRRYREVCGRLGDEERRLSQILESEVASMRSRSTPNEVLKHSKRLLWELDIFLNQFQSRGFLFNAPILRST